MRMATEADEGPYDLPITLRKKIAGLKVDAKGKIVDDSDLEGSVVILPEDEERLIGCEFVHFKGEHVRIANFAFDGETLEPMVVYRRVHGTDTLLVLPVGKFFEEIMEGDYIGPRYCLYVPSNG